MAKRGQKGLFGIVFLSGLFSGGNTYATVGSPSMVRGSSGAESHENKVLKTICKRLDMKFDGVAHCHRFRHSFASNALRAEANIAVFSKLLRHSNINVTCSHYLHISDSDMEDTLKLL